MFNFIKTKFMAKTNKTTEDITNEQTLSIMVSNLITELEDENNLATYNENFPPTILGDLHIALEQLTKSIVLGDVTEEIQDTTETQN